MAGPADAFTSDGFQESALGVKAPPPYELVLIGLTKKRITTTAGLTLTADCTVPTDAPLDTLIVPGGIGLRRPGMAERAADWIVTRAADIRRIASVCTGLYALARSGLLDGRQATSHWAALQDIGKRFPKIRLKPDALYVQDGKFYTSAGVTAGIDLALALIEEDHGPAAALAVAREMVVYFMRPGGQNQFSDLLRFQAAVSNRFADLVVWIHSHLSENLDVERLAKRVYLSPRHFVRVFKQEFGVTPSAFVELARVSEARSRLTAVGRPVSLKALALSLGYSSEDAFRRAFERRNGVPPSAYRTALSAGSSIPTASSRD